MGIIMAYLFPIKNESFAAALSARDHYLSAHPELRHLQREIDARLHSASTTHNRLVVIHELMMDAFVELNNKLQRIKVHGG
jgi:hypothetical protein